MFGFFKSQITEKRNAYRDAIVEHLTSAANSTVSSQSYAALESVASLVGRSFASAKVKGARTRPLTPMVMNAIGRGLIRRSEVLFYIKPGDSGVSLYPASAWNMEGNYAPETWTYELTLSGPTKETTIRNVPYANVVHVRANVDPEKPWCGNSPANAASLTNRLLAALETSLGDEGLAAHGSILPVPGGSLDGLAADIKKSKGNVQLVESTAANWGSGSPAPRNDLQSVRFGFNAPATQLEARQQANEAMMNAAGVSGALFMARDSMSSQQAYRMMSYSLIEPLGKLVSYELSEKLDTNINLDFSALKASDIANRAGAFKRLVDGGMEIERALNVSGLLASDD